MVLPHHLIQLCHYRVSRAPAVPRAELLATAGAAVRPFLLWLKQSDCMLWYKIYAMQDWVISRRI